MGPSSLIRLCRGRLDVRTSTAPVPDRWPGTGAGGQVRLSCSAPASPRTRPPTGRRARRTGRTRCPEPPAAPCRRRTRRPRPPRRPTRPRSRWPSPRAGPARCRRARPAAGRRSRTSCTRRRPVSRSKLKPKTAAVELAGPGRVGDGGLVPHQRAGLVVDLDAGGGAGLPEAERVALRIGGDGHPAVRADVHRRGEHLPPAAVTFATTASTSSAAKYVVQRGGSSALICGPRPAALRPSFSHIQ